MKIGRFYDPQIRGILKSADNDDLIDIAPYGTFAHQLRRGVNALILLEKA